MFCLTCGDTAVLDWIYESDFWLLVLDIYSIGTRSRGSNAPHSYIFPLVVYTVASLLC